MWCPDLSLVPETRSTRGESIPESQLTDHGFSAVPVVKENLPSEGEPWSASRFADWLTSVAFGPGRNATVPRDLGGVFLSSLGSTLGSQDPSCTLFPSNQWAEQIFWNLLLPIFELGTGSPSW